MCICMMIIVTYLTILRQASLTEAFPRMPRTITVYMFQQVAFALPQSRLKSKPGNSRASENHVSQRLHQGVYWFINTVLTTAQMQVAQNQVAEADPTLKLTSDMKIALYFRVIRMIAIMIGIWQVQVLHGRERLDCHNRLGTTSASEGRGPRGRSNRWT